MSDFKLQYYRMLLSEVDDEIEKAINNFPAFHSLHEGYAVLLEEVDELWQYVKCKQGTRPSNSVRKECIQIAAMACRIIIDCEKDGYQK
jgi:hypothetical protein